MIQLKILLLLSILSTSALKLKAQLFEQWQDIEVIENDSALQNPWAGGINSCQISHLDVNFDGKPDLFLFDKSSSRISIYLNLSNTPGEINYQYTTAYNHLFPTGLRNWVLIRDLNCDGKGDIITNSGGGFVIYWNNSSDNSLLFSATPTPKVKALYEFDNGSSYTANIYSVAPDISAFEDIDGDGDIDIITWTESALSLYLYINMAVESGNCSEPHFVCKGMCYGMMGEASDSFEIYTGVNFNCFQDVSNPRSLNEAAATSLHVGGTIMLVDLDQNGIKDLILGDVGANNLVAIPLTKSSNNRDSAMFVIQNFPENFPVNLPDFPAGYYLDIDNDGVSDMVIANNSYSGAEDRYSLWLYLNRGENDLPEFEFIQTDFLQEDQIDLGSGAFPVVFDVDNDGKKDLLISNLSYYDGLNNLTSKIHYYRNIGTITSPAFELVDDNWMDIPGKGWRGVYPSFGDLNGDEISDMIIGEQNGTLHYFQNTATAGQSATFQLVQSPLKDSNNLPIDIGQFAVPQIVDLTGDGKNDLVVGEYNGNINFYENIGSNTEFIFNHFADTLGGVVASSILGIQGKSVPHFFKNNQDEWELLIGSETGQINHYHHISGNLNGVFTLVNSSFENIYEGERAAPFLADINGDGLNELFVGNNSGGISIYKGLVVAVEEFSETKLSFSIYPNPANNFIEIKIDNTYFSTQETTATIYDTFGRIVKQQPIGHGNFHINIAHLSDGLYIINLNNNHLSSISRFIIHR